MSGFIKYIIEFIGTFIVLSVILSIGNPIAIAIALCALLTAIYFECSIRCAHYNPAITFVRFVNSEIEPIEALIHVCIQLIGAYTAYIFVYKIIKHK